MMRRLTSTRTHCLLHTVAGTFGILLCSAVALAQPAPGAATAMRDRIRAAQQNHASDEELGRLWLGLGNGYQSQLILPEADDAFAHDLRLLAGKDYARSAYKRSAELYEPFGNTLLAANLHESLALAYMFQRKFRNAEAQSLLARTLLESLSAPRGTLLLARARAAELLAASVTPAYALCYEERLPPSPPFSLLQ